MKKLYEFNMSFEHEDTPYTSTSRKRKQEHPECWATFGLRLMLMLLYTVSMLCLLRYDEALRITWADVHFENLPNGPFPFRVRLDLPFRKTHQHGGRHSCLIYSHSNSPCSFAGIAPFYLYACPEKPWMCPVRLFARWWALSDGSKGGYVFRKKMGNRFSANPFERMVSPLVYSDLISISHHVRRLNHSWTASVTTSVISTLILDPMALIPSVGGVVNILPWCSAGPSVTSVPGEVGQKTSTTLAPYSNISSPGQTPPCLNVKITLIQTELAVILAPPVAALVLVHRHLQSRYEIQFISYKTFRKYRYMVSVIMVQCPSTNNKELFKNNKVVRLKVTIVLIARFL